MQPTWCKNLVFCFGAKGICLMLWALLLLWGIPISAAMLCLGSPNDGAEGWKIWALMIELQLEADVIYNQIRRMNQDQLSKRHDLHSTSKICRKLLPVAFCREMNAKSRLQDLVVMPSYDTHVAGEWLGQLNTWICSCLGLITFKEKSVCIVWTSGNEEI